MAGGGPPGASLVVRTIDVLSAFDEHHRRLSAAEVADRSGLARSTALRIVRQLVTCGALTRRSDGRYEIGRRLWGIGLLAPVQTDLREVAAPYLHDLQAATGATVHIGVRDRDQVLYLDRMSGSRSVPIVSRVGSRLPLHTTGVGKVLLAHAPLSVAVRILTAPLSAVTPFSITSRSTLERQLEQVRRDGFATTHQEMSLGASSIAIPITDADDVVVAALGIVVPNLQRERTRLLAALTVAAHGVHRELLRHRAW